MLSQNTVLLTSEFPYLNEMFLVSVSATNRWLMVVHCFRFRCSMACERRWISLNLMNSCFLLQNWSIFKIAFFFRRAFHIWWLRTLCSRSLFPPCRLSRYKTFFFIRDESFLLIKSMLSIVCTHAILVFTYLAHFELKFATHTWYRTSYHKQTLVTRFLFTCFTPF